MEVLLYYDQPGEGNYCDYCDYCTLLALSFHACMEGVQYSTTSVRMRRKGGIWCVCVCVCISTLYSI